MGERLLIGIAAPTCSGKTSLIRELNGRIGGESAFLSFDEYDLYPSGSPALKDALQTGTIKNWENPALFDYEKYVDDLRKLREGQPVTLLSRSRESLTEGVEFRTISPTTYTFVEGIFVYSDERVVELFDRRFYIDIPVDEMVRRRILRTPLESQDPWDQREYIETEMVVGTEYYVKPQIDRAHVVLNGLRPSAELAEQVIFELAKMYP